MIQLVRWIYIYCTDFMINLANLMHLSYYETNFFLFCIIFPAMLVASSAFYIFQLIRLNRLKKKSIE